MLFLYLKVLPQWGHRNLGFFIFTSTASTSSSCPDLKTISAIEDIVRLLNDAEEKAKIARIFYVIHSVVTKIGTNLFEWNYKNDGERNDTLFFN